MIAADLRQREGFGVAHIRVAHDGQVVAEWLERAEAARRQVEVPADRLGRPQILLQADRRGAGRPVHHLHADESCFRCRSGRGRLRERGSRRNHGIEDRQGHGDAHALENGTT
jgi:hypothetical protein